MALKDDVLAYSREIGIDLIGITSPEPFERYLSELAKRQGYYSERWSYRIDTWKKFGNPKLLLPDARSVIVIGFHYFTPTVEDDGVPRGKLGRIVTYGHLAILKRLGLLAKFLENKGYKTVKGAHRKEAAVRAGLGQIGKHSLVINEKYGSWVAYQTIVTDAELEFDEPSTDDICGNCEKCIKACPLSALYEAHRLDPRRCICSLLTSPDIRQEFWDSLNNYILGCDICQENCHKNEGLEPKRFVESLFPDWIGINPPLDKLLRLDEKHFQKEIIAFITGKVTGSPLVGFLMRYQPVKKLLKHFSESADKETLPQTFILASGNLHTYQRNAIIAAGSMKNQQLRSEIEAYRDHPELQKYAQWALKRINA